ncbi:MAG: hypothetical protein GY906_36520 [bacterium]|nr:hypothetical protein [bacterium]
MAKKSVLGLLVVVSLWIAAFLVSAGLAVYQRLTGPTHPLRGTIEVADDEVSYRLLRSHGGEGDLPVQVEVASIDVEGEIMWRRFPTTEEWSNIQLSRSESVLSAGVPHQPPAGKVEYQIRLFTPQHEVFIPAHETAVARFKGDVPSSVLIPHILAMFGSMLVYTRALFQAGLKRGEGVRGLVLVGTLLLVIGGLILGPIVQNFAFGAYWTGWPFGTDLTDNKTALLLLAWLPAVWVAMRRERAFYSVIFGWLIMVVVFLIPHSVRGSQIDWNQRADTGIEDLSSLSP